MTKSCALFRTSRAACWIAAALLIASCGGGGGNGDSGRANPVEQQVITAKVIDGYLAFALVCLDVGGNGRCDPDDPQARTDSGGAYSLTIPRGSTAPLIAEVAAGVSRDLGPPASSVDHSYRMASPGVAYSADITPFTTLVHLAGDRDYALAEDIVRNEIGLPPRYPIAGDFVASNDAYAQSVARSIVGALKSMGTSLDLSAPDGLAKVVAALPEALTTLPQLRITTRNAAPILDRENYVDATFVLTNPAAAVPAYTLNGKIRGRGHSTWGWPKNPYKVQFNNDTAYAAVPDFLGMKRQRNWALLADYFDRSLMRNKLSLSMGSSAVFRDGLKWTPSGQHLEVWLNDEYVGVYLLTEDIRIDPNRLAIRSMSKSPDAGEVDGGYIVEVDARLDCYNQGDLNLQHMTPRQVPMCVSKPDEADITLPQLAWVKTMVDGVEADVYAGDTSTINLASFVDFYLLSELLRNNDAVFYSSVYLWKDTAGSPTPDDRVVNLGPLWDFDRAAGNVNENANWETEGCWVDQPIRPNWFAVLAGNPQFVELAVERWKAKRGSLERFVDASIGAYARRLDEAQQRNFAKWPIFGVPLTNHYTFAGYAEEVAFLKQFLTERMRWMDKAFASPASFAAMCR